MKLRPGNPLGCSFDRNGFGAGGSPRCLRFSGIDLALEAETQGAKKILMTFSLDSHCISKLTPVSVVRSATATGAKCIDHSKSLQLSRNPWRTGEDRLWESKFYIHFFQPQKRASNKSNNLICRPEFNIIRLKNTSIYGQCRNYRTEVEEYEGTVIYRTLLFYNSVFLGRCEKKRIWIYS